MAIADELAKVPRRAWLALGVAAVLVALVALPWAAPFFYWNASPFTRWVPPPPEGVQLNKTDEFVLRAPKIIHHRWNDEHIPERWAHVRNRCIAMHPDYEFMLWTEEKERALIAEHFPFFLRTYDNYQYIIQHADVGRYFFLYVYGGLYLDLDVECLQRVDYLLSYELILPRTWPVGFSNDMLVSAPKHPLWKQAIHALPAWNHVYGTKYGTVMFGTGPMFLTYQTMLYPNRNDIWVLPKSLYGKWTNSPVAFFQHYYASMWHSNDATMFKHIWAARLPILLLAVVLVAGYMWGRNCRKTQLTMAKVV